MWTFGGVSINRAISYQRNAPGAAPIWISIPGTWGGGPNLNVNPAEFIFASMKTAARGHAPGWRGMAAGGFAGCSAMSYLIRNPAAGGLASLTLHGDINDAKDFYNKAIKGVVGASLAFLEMTDQGYPWFGHWEDAFGPTGLHEPDFIFLSNARMALVEAKATESINPQRERKIKSDWTRQVQPCLGLVGGEGWILTTCLSQTAGTTIERAFRPPPLAAAGAGAGVLPPGAQPAVIAGAVIPQTQFHTSVWAIAQGLLDWLDLPWAINRDLVQQMPAQIAALAAAQFGSSMVIFGKPIAGLILGGASFRATPFCKLETLMNVFQILANPNARQMPNADGNPIMDLLGEASVLWWPDGTGIRFDQDSSQGGVSFHEMLRGANS